MTVLFPIRLFKKSARPFKTRSHILPGVSTILGDGHEHSYFWCPAGQCWVHPREGEIQKKNLADISVNRDGGPGGGVTY